MSARIVQLSDFVGYRKPPCQENNILWEVVSDFRYTGWYGGFLLPMDFRMKSTAKKIFERAYSEARLHAKNCNEWSGFNIFPTVCHCGCILDDAHLIAVAAIGGGQSKIQNQRYLYVLNQKQGSQDIPF